MKLWCCGCERYTDADLTAGFMIYPHREDLSHLLFYQCPVCKNYVGTHKKRGYDCIENRQSIAALGCIPTPELKRARQHIHAILDPLWKGKKSGTRTKLYKKISDELGYEYHTAQTRTIEECRKVYRIILTLKG